MRHTIRAIIIKDKKVLLVTGHGADFYWTPGGGVEPGETPQQTLRRELREELGVELLSMHPHSTYIDADQHVENYRVEIDGPIRPGEEITGTAWYSTASGIQGSHGFTTKVLPQLLRDGLIN